MCYITWDFVFTWGFSIFFSLLSSSFEKMGATDVTLRCANHCSLRGCGCTQEDSFEQGLMEGKGQRESLVPFWALLGARGVGL